MKNIQLLPTDKPSKLVKLKMFGKDRLHLFKGILSIQDEEQYQNIYITSDEKIKEGDWFLNTLNGKLDKCDDLIYEKNVNLSNWCKKIILTTDQDLIKDGVQAIDDTFLEWFIKNPSCESIEVCKNPFYEESNYEHYKIIIPQEEPKQSNNFYEELKHYFETTPREKVLKDWNESVELDKIGPTVEEFLGMIQETLEEAAEKQWGKLAIINDRAAVIAFKAGAKWQQEQDKNKYSEEEVLIILDKFLTSMIKSEKTGLLEEWFEQFKKK